MLAAAAAVVAIVLAIMGEWEWTFFFAAICFSALLMDFVLIALRYLVRRASR